MIDEYELEMHAHTARKLLDNPEWVPSRLLWHRLVSHLESALSRRSLHPAGQISGEQLQRAKQAWHDAHPEMSDTIDGALRAALEAALSPADHVAEADGWRDIASAPKDGTHVLAREPDKIIAEVFWTLYPEADREALGDGFWEYDIHLLSGAWGEAEPTHWMPLPASPTPVQDEGVKL